MYVASSAEQGEIDSGIVGQLGERISPAVDQISIHGIADAFLGQWLTEEGEIGEMLRQISLKAGVYLP